MISAHDSSVVKIMIDFVMVIFCAQGEGVHDDEDNSTYLLIIMMSWALVSGRRSWCTAMSPESTRS